MRFTSLVVLSATLVSASAIAIPKHLGQLEHAVEHISSPLERRFDARLKRRAGGGFFHTGDSSSSSSGTSNPSTSEGNRTPSPHQGSNSGSSLGIGRIPSPEHRESTQQHDKVTFGTPAKEHLNDLGLHGKDRDNVKKDHVSRIKQEMKTNGATHATVEHLAHAQGSVDPNIHITATFQKASQAANGGVHKEPITSSWTDHSTGEKVTSNNHHVYANMEDKTKGREAMPIHHPTYDRTLRNKAPDGVAKYRRRSMAYDFDYEY